MDNPNPHRQHNQPSSSRDIHRLLTETKERREAQEKETKRLGRLCRLYKDLLEVIPRNLGNLEETFNNDYSNAYTLQTTADYAFKRFIAISPIEEFINAVLTARNLQTSIRNHKEAGALSDVLPSSERHGLLSQYLRNKRLNPSDFEDVFSILDNDNLTTEDITKSVRESVGLKKVINTQKQVYNCMSNAISNFQQGLQALQRGGYASAINKFLQDADKVCPINISRAALRNDQASSNRRDTEVRLYPLYKVEGLTDSIEMDSELNQETFLQIKKQNSQIYNDNVKCIRNKVYNTRYGIPRLISELQ
jgi:hypothetical protein